MTLYVLSYSVYLSTIFIVLAHILKVVMCRLVVYDLCKSVFILDN